MPQYENAKSYLDSLVNNNQQIITDYASNFNQLNSLNTQYDLLTNQVQADYSNYQMADALSKGNYTDAAKAYTDLQKYNQNILTSDPSAQVATPSLSTTQADFLSKYATDPSQYGAQASQVFANYTANYTPTTDTTSTGTNTSTGTSTNPYDNLPKYPGTDTTTGTGTTTGTSSSLSPVGNLQQSSPGNFVDTLGRVFTKQIINGVTNYVLSSAINGTPTTPTPTPPKPTISRPAQHVDISSLKPFTGTLPTGLATTTPQPSTTGGLPTTTTPATTAPLSNVTNPTQTPTQTANSGLQSVSQPQVQAKNSPAKHVDISTLTPVTNNTQLANLGLNIG